MRNKIYTILIVNFFFLSCTESKRKEEVIPSLVKSLKVIDSLDKKIDSINEEKYKILEIDSLDLLSIPVERKIEKIKTAKLQSNNKTKVYQLFNLDLSKDTIIYGQEGTKIKIPKKSLDLKGSVNCTLRLIECYSIYESFKNGLLTDIDLDHAVLSSKGMVFIDIVDENDNSVELLSDLSINYKDEIYDDTYCNYHSKDGKLWLSNSISSRKKNSQKYIVRYNTDSIKNHKYYHIKEKNEDLFTELLWYEKNGFGEELVQSFYSYSVSSFGWQNLDRLELIEKDKTLTLNINQKRTDAYLFSRKRNILLKATENEGQLIFNKIPKIHEDLQILILEPKSTTKCFYNVIDYKDQIIIQKGYILLESTMDEMTAEFR